MRRLIEVPAIPAVVPPAVKQAARHATRSMKPHMYFLALRATFFVPIIVYTMPHDHAVFLIDAGLIEVSGIVVLWVRRIRRALRGVHPDHL